MSPRSFHLTNMHKEKALSRIRNGKDSMLKKPVSHGSSVLEEEGCIFAA